MKENNFDLTEEELKGLPDEVLRELKFDKKYGKTLSVILECLQKLGGAASVDQIIVSLYRKNKEIIRRNTLLGKIYRLQKLGKIKPYENRKGVYMLSGHKIK